MTKSELVSLYLEYLKNGISFEQLYNMFKYDFELYLKKINGQIDKNTVTDIKSLEDAKIKEEALMCAKDILEFPPYILKYTMFVNKNTTLD